MSTFLLSHPYQNHRGHSESFSAYRARRRASNKEIAQKLKGRLAFTSTRPVTLPVLGINAQVDGAVLAQHYRDLTTITLPGGKEARVGRTKGVSFKYPVPRAEARKVALAASREARA